MSGILQSLFGIVIGCLLWPFFEYFVHGILSHRFKTPVSPLHWGHHIHLQSVFTPALAWVPVTLILTSLFVWAFGKLIGLGLASGLLLGFFHYEYCHWRIHFKEPKNSHQQKLRDHHLAHHFRNPKAYFGVTTILCDRLFGSLTASAEEDYAAASKRHPLGLYVDDKNKKAA